MPDVNMNQFIPPPPHEVVWMRRIKFYLYRLPLALLLAFGILAVVALGLFAIGKGAWIAANWIKGW